MDINRQTVLSALIATVLVGCGGGGGDSGGDSNGSSAAEQDNTSTVVTPGDTDSLPEQKMADAISTDFVSGQVTTPDGSPISDVEVVLAFQGNSQHTLSELSTTSDSEGYYQVSVPTIEVQEGSETASKLIITFDKKGFANNEKSIAINDASDIVRLDAILAPVAINTVKREDLDELVVSANGVPSLRFSLVKSIAGKQRILVGDVSAAAGEETQLSLDLPIANIPESVEAISSEVAYFDSSDENDIQSFPGDFVGQGETEDQGEGISFERSDSDESYRLISSTFSQIKLTDESENPLPLSDLQASSELNPSITMIIPPGSYKTIQRDFDLGIEGIQIPIYVYKSGEGWQFAGNGLLVNDANGQSPTTDTDISIEQDGVIDLTDYNNPLYVKVEITEANRWIQWINLDWPIKNGAEVTDICFTGEISYDNGEAYVGQFNAQLPDGGSEWVMVNDGHFEFTVALADNYDKASALNGDNWKAAFPVRNGKTGQKEFIPVPGELIEGANNCNDNKLSLELFNPFQCTLTGHLYAANGTSPIANEVIAVSHASGRSYAQSDSTGRYELTIPCGLDVDVAALAQEKTGKTTQDTPNLTIDFVKANLPPLLGAVRIGSDEIKIDETVSFRWSTSDPDGDAVTVTVDCGEDECQIEQQANSATLDFTSIGQKKVVIRASDGKAATEKSFGLLVRDTDNIAPEIIGFKVGEQMLDSDETLPVLEGSDIVIEAITRDRNGDSLAFEWNGCTSFSKEQCTVTDAQIGQVDIALKVTDNHSQPITTPAVMTLDVQADQAPTVELFVSPSKVGSDGNNNLAEIRVVAMTDDDFTDIGNLTYQWLLKDKEGSEIDWPFGDNTSIDGFTIGLGELEVGPYSLELSVTDGAAEPNTTVKSVDFEVQANIAPSVSVTPDQSNITVLEGASSDSDVTFSAVIADDHGLDNLTIEWSLSVNGNADTSLLQVSNDKQAATLAGEDLLAGSYVVTVTVTDEGGLATTATSQVTVIEDKKPLISSMTVTPGNQKANEAGYNPEAFILTLVASDDNDEPTVTWSTTPLISIEDEGSSISIPVNTLSVGSYSAQATVTDSRGQSTSQSVTFSVLEFEGNVGIIIE